ncbi:poly(A) RNA polymerase GLD2-A-like isoform X2 [Gordionus sp. m RMFG-2023]
MERIIIDIFPTASLFIIGSSNSGFSVENSDLDMCLYIPDMKEEDHRTICSNLYQIQSLFRNPNTLRSTLVIPARVPILKLVDVKNDIEVDLNINNIVGVYNTYLMKAYSYVDCRVAPLIIIVKHWAKFHNINDASKQSLNSYSLALMVLHYLQVCHPPVIPALQQRNKELFDIDNYSLQHFSDYKSLKDKLIWKSENEQSLGQLLRSFFHYYAYEFKFDTDAISVRLGAKIHRSQVNRNIPNIKYRHNQSWKYICVEEPFDKTNTAYSTYNINTFNLIKLAIIYTFKQLDLELKIGSIFHKLPV